MGIVASGRGPALANTCTGGYRPRLKAGPKVTMCSPPELSTIIADTYLYESHGHLISRTTGKIDPRHRPAAGPACQRNGAVRLSGQPFPQPRARQCLDDGAREGRLHPHAILAISPHRGRVLHRVSGARRARHLGAVRAAPVQWKAMEPLQLVLGLSIPALIIAHIVGVRLGQTLFGHEKLYPQELYLFFVAAPMKLWQMFAVLVIAWVHGCIGLYFWLRMKAFYRRARAVPARRRGADPDARLARDLSGRPNGHCGQPFKRVASGVHIKRSGRHRRPAGGARQHHGLPHDGVSRAGRPRAARQGARVPLMSGAAA